MYINEKDLGFICPAFVVPGHSDDSRVDCISPDATGTYRLCFWFILAHSNTNAWQNTSDSE